MGRLSAACSSSVSVFAEVGEALSALAGDRPPFLASVLCVGGVGLVFGVGVAVGLCVDDPWDGSRVGSRSCWHPVMPVTSMHTTKTSMILHIKWRTITLVLRYW